MAIEFKTLETDDVTALVPWFEAHNLRLSVYTAAYIIMWDRHIALQYAETEGCIVFCEKFRGAPRFYYPVSKDGEDAELKAVAAVEEYCRKNGARLHWTNVPRTRLGNLTERYGADLHIKSYLKWRDYLYAAADFREYPGKKFSGQRNHVNKFKKLYPQYKFEILTGENAGEIREFFKEYEHKQLAKGTAIAKAEMEAAFRLLPYMDKIGMKAGGIRIDGKLASVTMGEVCGDTLMVDIEKALDFEGIYPVTAQEFARAYTGGAVQFINREDDAGDRGLRKSKLQYNPVARLDKYNLTPLRPIDEMTKIPHIKHGRVEIGEFSEDCAGELFRLETDSQTNRFWGYDWRTDYKGEDLPAPEYFLNCKRKIFAAKEEVPMGVFLAGTLIGEVVLHNFGYGSECEVGIRLLPEYRKKGYAAEAVEAAVDYAFFELNIDKVIAKCFKQNADSRKCLLSAGMRECGGDETYFYFYKTPAT